ncbi:methionine aminopeptidase 1D, mitochondrial-like [Planococcus citri]|uniref:methionine aminopeptidase 1D, mitochondrial-like n=1 Tax=Planococcus citri TaxID=170843 RepID=UPI0031F8BE3C
MPVFWFLFFTSVISPITSQQIFFGHSGEQAEKHYRVVDPLFSSISPAQVVPDHIPRPAYVFNNGEEESPSKILIKNASEIDAIAASCSLVRSVLKHLKEFVQDGKTTDEIDAYAHKLIIQGGAYPTPLKYHNFPKSICTSVNNIAIHGIPDSRKLANGDIITIDVSVYLNGYHGDGAETFLIGEVDDAGRRLVEGAREILYSAIECCRPGEQFIEIGRRVDTAAKKRGLHNLLSNCGHGIGKFLHEHPFIMINNTESGECNETMQPGMVFAIEPLIGENCVECMRNFDNITIMTTDFSRVAQFEHTIVITEESYRILT